MLYQLGEYNSKSSLSLQAKNIRNHLLSKHDFESVFRLISEYTELEEESIIILRKAINAGHWDSRYGFNWSHSEELDFWEAVMKQSNGLTISRLQLVRTQQITADKNIEELIIEYIAILEAAPSMYYELMNNDLVEIWKTNNNLKEACLTAMFKDLSLDMDLKEFTKEVDYQINNYYPDNDIPNTLIAKIDEMKAAKAQDEA
ncbi:MAG: hypothetical protein ACRBG0_06165 [Lewinella sp.]|uniref:hypothetical protein n=1 Tax=Lewinella sp. TaxID=2004506 RepID=UPI003D6BE164